ncbi:MAG TPA: hypothetical protein VK553_08890 [Candidatus Nitrosopolaris rasttigaisensis]|nr:hypothetical protein [Candidatus Nitrosopolaris rasttigaisensis]
MSTNIYYHMHHIIPKHMGGTNDPLNLERLTIQEHAARHYELWYLVGMKQDYIAWKALSGARDFYDEYKQFMRENNTGNKNPMYGKKRPDLGIVSKNNAKEWMVTNPNGDTKKIKSLNQFCIDNNLTQSLMWAVSQGKQTHHKHWKCQLV